MECYCDQAPHSLPPVHIRRDSCISETFQLYLWANGDLKSIVHEPGLGIPASKERNSYLVLMLGVSCLALMTAPSVTIFAKYFIG